MKKQIISKITYIVLGFILLEVLILIGTLVYMIMERQNLYSNNAAAGDREKEYSRHIAMIVNDPEDEFWKSVFSGAAAAGEENDAYVEFIGSGMDVAYDKRDLMNIAIAADVDGILLECDGTQALSEMIDEADEKGIPVVTLFRDAVDSKRICFVGISYYNLGQQYAEQIIDIVSRKKAEGSLANGQADITVLINEDIPDTARTIILSTIQDQLNSYGQMGSILSLQPKLISSDKPFEAEESIRNIFVEKNELPDIFVCLDQICSACVYQAIVDYNQVGKVELIGYYTENPIISGIGKKIIASTTAVDTEALGSSGMKAILEKLETGYCSDYYSVDTFVVNSDNYEVYTGGAE